MCDSRHKILRREFARKCRKSFGATSTYSYFRFADWHTRRVSSDDSELRPWRLWLLGLETIRAPLGNHDKRRNSPQCVEETRFHSEKGVTLSASIFIF